MRQLRRIYGHKSVSSSGWTGWLQFRSLSQPGDKTCNGGLFLSHLRAMPHAVSGYRQPGQAVHGTCHHCQTGHHQKLKYSIPVPNTGSSHPYLFQKRREGGLTSWCHTWGNSDAKAEPACPINFTAGSGPSFSFLTQSMNDLLLLLSILHLPVQNQGIDLHYEGWKYVFFVTHLLPS